MVSTCMQQHMEMEKPPAYLGGRGGRRGEHLQAEQWAERGKTYRRSESLAGVMSP